MLPETALAEAVADSPLRSAIHLAAVGKEGAREQIALYYAAHGMESGRDFYYVA